MITISFPEYHFKCEVDATLVPMNKVFNFLMVIDVRIICRFLMLLLCNLYKIAVLLILYRRLCFPR